MAFSSTITNRAAVGANHVIWGTFASTGGSTGGDIATGLRRVEYMHLQPIAAAVTANSAVVNEIIPGAAGTAVTIVTDANVSGLWIAIGDL